MRWKLIIVKLSTLRLRLDWECEVLIGEIPDHRPPVIDAQILEDCTNDHFHDSHTDGVFEL